MPMGPPSKPCRRSPAFSGPMKQPSKPKFVVDLGQLAILRWLLEYVGTMHYLFKVGDDGLTPRGRITGQKVHRTMVPICQKVLYERRMAALKQQGAHLGKAEVKFEVGVMLGIKLDDMTYIVGAENGDVCVSNVIKALPEDELWDFHKCQGVKGLPWRSRPSLTPGEEREEAMKDAAEMELPPVEIDEDPQETKGRGMKITKANLSRHGLHPGPCDGCRAVRLKTPARLHSEPAAEDSKTQSWPKALRKRPGLRQ